MKKNLCILFVAFVFGVSAFADKKADIEKLLQVSESNSIVAGGRYIGIFFF